MANIDGKWGEENDIPHQYRGSNFQGVWTAWRRKERTEDKKGDELGP